MEFSNELVNARIIQSFKNLQLVDVLNCEKYKDEESPKISFMYSMTDMPNLLSLKGFGIDPEVAIKNGIINEINSCLANRLTGVIYKLCKAAMTIDSLEFLNECKDDMVFITNIANACEIQSMTGFVVTPTDAAAHVQPTVIYKIGELNGSAVYVDPTLPFADRRLFVFPKTECQKIKLVLDEFNSVSVEASFSEDNPLGNPTVNCAYDILTDDVNEDLFVCYKVADNDQERKL